jgi:hypothetical protein
MDDKDNNYSKYPAFESKNRQINSSSFQSTRQHPSDNPVSSGGEAVNSQPQVGGSSISKNPETPQYQQPESAQVNQVEKANPPQNFQQTQPSAYLANNTDNEKTNEPPIKVATTEEHIIQSAEPQQNAKTGNSGSGGNWKKILFIIILFFLTLSVSSAALVYAVAYKKVDINNKPLQKKVAHFVMNNIPFAPVTPEYIIEKTALTHKDITKTSYDLSLAVNTDQGSLTDFGFDNFDMKVVGAVDFTNPNNILATADISVMNAFGMQIMTKDNILYFKVSQFPTNIFSLLNVDPSGFDPLINQWIMYDTSTLDSEARAFLDQEILSKQQELLEDQAGGAEEIIDKKILENITVYDEIYNDYDSYRLEFVAAGDMIDYMIEKAAESQSRNDLLYTDTVNETTEKPSDYIKEFKVLAWIEKDTFYTRKILFSTTIISDEDSFDLSSPFGFFPGGGSEKTKITITGAMLLDNFGKDVFINTPDNSLKVEEVYEIFSKAVYGESYMNTYELPDAWGDLKEEETLSEENTFSEDEIQEFYYEFEDASDVLGWFDQRLDDVNDHSIR